MRIGVVSWESLHSIPVGGVAAHVSELAAALARGGDEVHLVTRLGAGQSGYDRIDGVHYHRCGYDARSDFIADTDSMCGAFVNRLWQIEDSAGRFDVVHGHDWLTTKAAVWARHGRGRRVVMTIHSTEYGRCGNYMREDGVSRAIRDREWEAQYEAAHVITVSNALRDEVLRLYATPPEKVSTIYNGVLPQRYDGWIDQGQVKIRCGIGPLDPMVLFVGRLTFQKGCDMLLEAAPRILSHMPQARVVFVGDGDMRHSLEDRTVGLGVGHAVRFLGQRGGQNLVDIFRAADVVCVPSRNEPFGIVILEAWSAGKPVVASPNGGPGEFVWHGVTGLKTQIDPDSLTRSLLHLLQQPMFARWIGRNGRAAAETAFSWDTIAARTRQVYEYIRDGDKEVGG